MRFSIMDPFNVGPAMDGGAAVKAGDGIAYADGPRKKLDVYAPKNPDAKSPVIFFIYGGGWNHGDRGDYAFLGNALATRGFVVVIPDYRLYPDVKYPAFLEDNAQALKWVEDNIATYGGDPERLFIAGHSAGAYNAVMLGLDHSFLREYNVTLSIKGIAALSGPYDFYPFEYDEVRNTFGSAPSPEGTQPVNLVTPGLRRRCSSRPARTIRSFGRSIPNIWRKSCATTAPGSPRNTMMALAIWSRCWRSAPCGAGARRCCRTWSISSSASAPSRAGRRGVASPRICRRADGAQIQDVITKLDSVLDPIGGRRNE